MNEQLLQNKADKSFAGFLQYGTVFSNRNAGDKFVQRWEIIIHLSKG